MNRKLWILSKLADLYTGFGPVTLGVPEREEYPFQACMLESAKSNVSFEANQHTSSYSRESTPREVKASQFIAAARPPPQAIDVCQLSYCISFIYRTHY
jgi:hypothetical protein